MLLEHEIGLNAYLLLFKKNVSSETNFSSDYLSDRDIPWIIYRAVVFLNSLPTKCGIVTGNTLNYKIYLSKN